MDPVLVNALKEAPWFLIMAIFVLKVLDLVTKWNASRDEKFLVALDKTVDKVSDNTSAVQDLSKNFEKLATEIRDNTCETEEALDKIEKSLEKQGADLAGHRAEIKTETRRK